MNVSEHKREGRQSQEGVRWPNLCGAPRVCVCVWEVGGPMMSSLAGPGASLSV